MRSENQEKTAVSQSQRVPHVPQESKNERKIQGDRRHKPEHRNLRRRCMKLVLQYVRSLDINQVTSRSDKIDEQRQPTEVKEGLACVRRIITSLVLGHRLRPYAGSVHCVNLSVLSAFCAPKNTPHDSIDWRGGERCGKLGAHLSRLIARHTRSRGAARLHLQPPFCFKSP
jgi:hypothetical protein